MRTQGIGVSFIVACLAVVGNLALKLVVTEDKHPARSVRNLVAIDWSLPATSFLVTSRAQIRWRSVPK